MFVYGTLMPGQSRWELIRPHVAALEQATTTGQLFDTGQEFPAARFDRPGEILGWVLTLHPAGQEEVLALLDRIEGDRYRRVTVETSDGDEALTYEWVGPVDDLEPIDGDWLSRGRPRS